MDLILATALTLSIGMVDPTIMNDNFNFKTGNKPSNAASIKRKAKKRKNKK
jgi:hypothetical protein